MKMQFQLSKSFQSASVPSVVSLVCVSLVSALLVSCKPAGQNTASELTVADEKNSEFEILTARQNTSLRTSLFQSDGLGGGAFCPIPQGTILTVDSIKPEGIGQWRVFSLMEVKLPNGEVGRVARTADASEQTAAATAESATGTVATLQSQTAAAPDAAAKVEKTPAQLLGCDMLNAESFLVDAAHFNRQKIVGKASASAPSAPSAPSVRESVGGDNGAFAWPTRGRKIRNDAGGSGYFNSPRASGHGHQGIDIVAAVGEPVLASRSGTIIDPAFENAYGNVVDVKHTDGYLTRYAHLTSFAYSHGVYVEKGDRIAVSGRTGNASGYGITPHLHFEIRQLGRLINPLSMLPE